MLKQLTDLMKNSLIIPEWQGMLHGYGYTTALSQLKSVFNEKNHLQLSTECVGERPRKNRAPLANDESDLNEFLHIKFNDGQRRLLSYPISRFASIESARHSIPTATKGYTNVLRPKRMCG